MDRPGGDADNREGETVALDVWCGQKNRKQLSWTLSAAQGFLQNQNQKPFTATY